MTKITERNNCPIVKDIEILPGETAIGLFTIRIANSTRLEFLP